MKASMRRTSRVSGLTATALALAATAACGGPQGPAPATPATTMALPELTASTIDTRGCEPAGKSIVVIERDSKGHPCRWRYFALVRHGHRSDRALTCEAADRNGDGKVDARYFYDAHGKLVFEQRDMDFDGRAEFVVDYSRFPTQGSMKGSMKGSTKGSLVRARDVGN
jgi:hypothetical protein